MAFSYNPLDAEFLKFQLVRVQQNQHFEVFGVCHFWRSIFDFTITKRGLSVLGLFQVRLTHELHFC